MNLLKDVSMRAKLRLLLALLLTTVLTTAFTQWRLNAAHADIARAYHQRYTSYVLANELRHSSDDLTRLARTYVVSGDSRWEQQYLEVLAIRSGKQARPAGYEGIYWDFRAAGVDVPGKPGETIALLDMMKREGFTDAEFAKLEEAARNSGDLVKTEVLAMNLVKGLVPDGAGRFVQGSPDPAKARDLMHNAEYHRNKAKIMQPVDDFFRLLDERTGNAIRTAEAHASSWQWLSAICAALMLGAFVVLLYGFFTAIIASMRQAVAATRQVAEGDLTAELPPPSKDEIGQLMGAIGAMTGKLSLLVGRVRASGQQIHLASGEIAAGNRDLSARTEAQASALQQTAASMEELTATVRQNADNARQANQLAQSASSTAVDGGEVVAKVVATMHGISDSSRKIADIINVIDGIAFQTNILALNAAVEAARAGEQGRGFAVVAGEVRNLAGRSSEAAKEIKRLITDSVERVEHGSALVDKAGSTMNEVVASIRRVTDIMGEISAASSQQSAGVGQVGEAVTQMDRATQQNAALVEEMAAAATSLNQQASGLSELVGVFRIAAGDDGQGTALAAPAPARAAAFEPAPRKAAPAVRREPAVAVAGDDGWATF